jgi:hypothetical protein
MDIRIVETQVRKCGRRKEHGMYIIGGDGAPNGVLARFNRLNPPIPYQVKMHRGPRVVDGDAILMRLPMEKWWIGASKDTEEKKSADEWALDTFGMTLNHRLHVGECAGVSRADEAISILVSKVQWNKRIISYFGELTSNKVQELPRVAPMYSRLHEHLLKYERGHAIGELMGVQATVWNIAYTIPPGKRSKYIPDLARILVLMNLYKDAAVMLDMFSKE